MSRFTEFRLLLKKGRDQKHRVFAVSDGRGATAVLHAEMQFPGWQVVEVQPVQG